MSMDVASQSTALLDSRPQRRAAPEGSLCAGLMHAKPVATEIDRRGSRPSWPKTRPDGLVWVMSGGGSSAITAFAVLSFAVASRKEGRGLKSRPGYPVLPMENREPFGAITGVPGSLASFGHANGS